MEVETQPIRAIRLAAKQTLDQLADEIATITGKRPSTAKLSRIERGLQPVPLDILPALRKITGISGRKLRPDLAEALADGEAA